MIGGDKKRREKREIRGKLGNTKSREEFFLLPDVWGVRHTHAERRRESVFWSSRGIKEEKGENTVRERSSGRLSSLSSPSPSPPPPPFPYFSPSSGPLPILHPPPPPPVKNSTLWEREK